MLERSAIYVGEPSEHLSLYSAGRGILVHDPKRYFRNRTIDLLFESVALHAGSKSIGVVLAGASDDGARGLAAIRNAQGHTFVSTPSIGTGDGMPENAVAHNRHVSAIAPIPRIAELVIAATQAEVSDYQRTEN